MRRVEGAAVEKAVFPLEQLLPQLDFVARPGAGRLEDRFELLFRGRLTDDAEAALGAVDAEGAACRLRPVDEEVHHLVRRFDRLFRLWRDELEQRAAQLVEARAVAAETRRMRRIRSSSMPNDGGSGSEVDLVQHDDLRPLVEPGP